MSLLDSASLIVTPNGYSENTIYSVIPSSGAGDLSFTRATDAWRTDSQGLIQRTPWNLLRFSEQFENVFWSKNTSTVISNNAIAPNGILTADKIFPNSTGSVRGVFTANHPINTYNFSVFAKADGKNFLYFYVLGSTANTGVWFNLSNGTIGTVGAAWTNAAITNVGNGWYRCSANVSLINATNNLYYFISDANNDINVTANGSDGILLWGAQLTESTSTLEYFPTTDRLDVPRIDYSLGGCPNILLEPQRTNLVLFSEQFDNASWTKSDTTITANTTISPSGVQNADTMSLTGTTSRVIAPNTLSAGTYTISVWIRILSGSGTMRFNLTLDGVNTNVIFSPTNQWQRFTTTFTAATSATLIAFRAQTFVGDVAIWGAQLETGSYPTSYIPTTNASVTRNADSFTRNNVFTNGFITAAGGTWFVELRNNITYTRDNALGTLALSDGSGNNAFRIRNIGTANSQLRVQKVVGGTASDLFTLTTSTVKIAIKWNGSTCDVFVNGIKEVLASAFTSTILENLTSVPQVPIYINKMALFPTPLTDAECIALTT